MLLQTLSVKFPVLASKVRPKNLIFHPNRDILVKGENPCWKVGGDASGCPDYLMIN